mmetsp:Transcript_34690/g.87783  ORF Transcript_34690/g.87783 Transcript_34690/m.87783 type:complete len:81 (-) Transcript_34690:1581-1823(-)
MINTSASELNSNPFFWAPLITPAPNTVAYSGGRLVPPGTHPSQGMLRRQPILLSGHHSHSHKAVQATSLAAYMPHRNEVA